MVLALREGAEGYLGLWVYARPYSLGTRESMDLGPPCSQDAQASNLQEVFA